MSMDTAKVSTQVSTPPGLPGHAFRLVKIIETRKDEQNRDIHYLTICLEHLVDGVPTRTKIATLSLRQPTDDREAPSLSWHTYMERDHDAI